MLLVHRCHRLLVMLLRMCLWLRCRCLLLLCSCWWLLIHRCQSLLCRRYHPLFHLAVQRKLPLRTL